MCVLNKKSLILKSLLLYQVKLDLLKYSAAVKTLALNHCTDFCQNASFTPTALRPLVGMSTQRTAECHQS